MKKLQYKTYICEAVNKKDRYILVKNLRALTVKDAETNARNYFNKRYFNKPKCRLMW